MCRFFSAIATRDGRLLYHDATDSHEHMIRHFGLREGSGAGFGAANFVCLEFIQQNGKADDPDSYTLTVDESETPVWFDADRRTETISKLKSEIKSMIVTDSRPFILGGRWILSGKPTIGKLVGATIEYAGNATIEDAGNATIKYANNATIKHAGDATIKDAGNATIKYANSATIKDAGDATIKYANNATIEYAGSATIEYANSATIEYAGDATIEHANSATIKYANNATIKDAGDATIIKK
ncbi:MAG: hypothetical protein ABFD89_03685 [Bryobacteraceae bacterium]